MAGGCCDKGKRYNSQARRACAQTPVMRVPPSFVFLICFYVDTQLFDYSMAYGWNIVALGTI